MIFCEILTNFLLILSLLGSGTLEHQSADVKDKRYEKLTPLSVGIHNKEGEGGGGSGQKDFFQTEQTSITLMQSIDESIISTKREREKSERVI